MPLKDFKSVCACALLPLKAENVTVKIFLKAGNIFFRVPDPICRVSNGSFSNASAKSNFSSQHISNQREATQFWID